METMHESSDQPEQSPADAPALLADNAPLPPSADRYRALFTAIDEGYGLLELLYDDHGQPLDWRIVEVNPAFERLTGLTDTVGKTARELNPATEPSWIELLDAVARTGEARRFEHRAAGLDRWFEVYASRVGDTGSRIVAVVFNNITERKQAVAALAEQARLLDLSNDAIIVRDTDNRITYWNRGATELYGWTRDEALGQDLHTLLRTEFDVPFTDLIQRLHQHDRMEGELVQVTRAGRRITTFCRWALDRNTAGQPVAILTTYNDITARKRAEAAVRESEERFRAVANLVPDLLWSNAPHGRTEWVNQRWFAYTGQTDDAAKGYGWLDAIHPDDRQNALRNFQTAIDTGAALRQEHRIRNAAGEYRWFLVQAHPLRNQAGHIVRWYGAATDIHEERMALAEAEAALKVRDQFLGIASHELRTPLHVVLGYAELLHRTAAQGTGATQAIPAKIIEQIHRLNGLIDQLLDVSRLEQGQFMIERQPVDLIALATQVADDVRTTLPLQPHYSVELLHPPAPVLVDGDAERLKQVLHNLLNNAIKYSPHGGLIRVRVAHTTMEAVVEVSDTGIGIPTDAQAHLFDLFYRAPNVGAQLRGFGLGLHIVKEIIERHAGHIAVESREGAGSTFRIMLPLHAREHAPTQGTTFNPA
jgi:PAS domain S-box-containing protein